MFSDPLLSDGRAPLLALDARFRGVSSRVRVHKSGGIFYAQLGNPRALAVFDDEHGLLRAAFAKGNASEMRAQVASQLADETLGRALLLPDPRVGKSGFFRVVWRDAESWVFLVDSHGEAIVFEPQTAIEASEVWGQRDAFWARRWNKEWRDAESDLRLSLAFITASALEREQWGIFWGKGSWDEVTQVARVAAIADDDCDLNAPLLLSAQFGYSGDRVTELKGNRPLSPRLERLLKLLLERNRAYCPESSRLRRSAPVPFRLAALRLRFPQLRLEIVSPSAHEQLEARFWMRGWPEQNAPALLRDWSPRPAHLPRQR